MEIITPIHPGYVVHKYPLDMEMRAARRFENYMPFVKPDGLDEFAAQAFIKFLRALFTQSHDFWEPACCGYMPNFLPVAQEKAGELFLQSVVKIKKYVYREETEKRNEDHHIWISLCLNDGQMLIVDPTGINTEPIFYRELFLPYFGLIAYAPETSINIYRNGSDLPMFMGYMVEEKLQEFRRHEIGGKWNQYISFNSSEGKELRKLYDLSTIVGSL